jgi:antitoxin ParD1/3/4
MRRIQTIRIITCNVPEIYLKAIDRLVSKNGKPGLYPSRSELIRVAVREFLIKELQAAKAFEELNSGKSFDNQLEISPEEAKQAALYKDLSI